MSPLKDRKTGRFCWVDLAATDEQAARRFYGRLFGWASEERRIERGSFGRFVLDGDAIASVYQLGRRHLEHGVPSHWTPYVAVDDASRAAVRAAGLGANVIVEPFDVAGVRIALVQDPVGALFGLWQRNAARREDT